MNRKHFIEMVMQQGDDDTEMMAYDADEVAWVPITGCIFDPAKNRIEIETDD